MCIVLHCTHDRVESSVGRAIVYAKQRVGCDDVDIAVGRQLATATQYAHNAQIVTTLYRDRLPQSIHALTIEPFGKCVADDADCFFLLHLFLCERSTAHEVVGVYLEEVSTGFIPYHIHIVIFPAHYKSMAAPFRFSRSCRQERRRTILDVRAIQKPFLKGFGTESRLPHTPALGFDA